MERMGYQQPKLDHIYGMAKVVAKYIKMKHPEVRKAFVVGQQAVRRELEQAGVQVLGADEHIFPPEQPISGRAFNDYELDPEVGAVVTALDTHFTYSKLAIASLYINEQKT